MNTNNTNTNNGGSETKKPSTEQQFVFFSPRPKVELDEAATRIQKVYQSHRTRRNLAECADLVEELWWKTMESAALNRSSVSSFDIDKKGTAASTDNVEVSKAAGFQIVDVTGKMAREKEAAASGGRGEVGEEETEQV